MQTDVPGGLVRAEPLDDVGLGLLYDADAAYQNDDDNERDDTDNDVGQHGYSSSFLSFKSLLPWESGLYDEFYALNAQDVYNGAGFY